MSQIVVTTITWFILVSLFFHMQGYVRTNYGMLNLVRAAPHLLKLARVGPRLLKLARAGRCLLNLGRTGPLIIGISGSGAALVRDGRGCDRYGCGCGSSLIRRGRGAGQGWPFCSLRRIDCCNKPHLKAILVSQAHLPAYWSA